MEPQPLSARRFMHALLRALAREDTSAWRTLLSARLRGELGVSSAALYEHFAAWRRDLLPLAGAIEGAEVALDATGVMTYSPNGDAPHVLASVVVEDGALRLDEN